MSFSLSLGCVFSDTDPPRSSSILRKGTTIMKTSDKVTFSLNALRHTRIWKKKGPSLGVFQPTKPPERSPYAPKFQDMSQQETEKQERRAREDAW